MITLFDALLHASLMLTIACFLAAILLRGVGITNPRLRQGLLFCVLLQGLMLFRLPVELPWLAAGQSSPTEAATQRPNWVGSGGASPWFAGSAQTDSAALISNTPADGRAGETFFSGEGFDTRLSLASMRPGESMAAAATSIWLAGVLVCLSVGAIRYRRLCRLVDRLDAAPEQWQSLWERLCTQSGCRAPTMLVSESAGPMLVRRSREYALVVPRTFWSGLSEDERRGIMLHECAHLRRRDVWRQLIARLVASVHWWNPAAWWCVRRYEESAEWSCDEALTRNDPDAARGLASGLIRLVESTDRDPSGTFSVHRGLGVQSMAAPPLTARVTRLLNPSSNGDPLMKRLLIGCVAVTLLTLSALQFRLVAADPDEAPASTETQRADEASSLNVLSDGSKQRLQELRERLDTNDKATSDLKRLLGSETGRVAFSGVVDVLENRYREQARDEALPQFVDRYFQPTDDNQLALREDSRETAEAWIARSQSLGETIESMQNGMRAIADRLSDSSDVNRLAQRMLRDEHAAFVILLEEFDGRSDPIEMFIGKAMDKILVERDGKLVVIPTLGIEQERQVERFEIASEVAEKLAAELPLFASDLAEVDERHKRLAGAMDDPAMAAVVALSVTDRGVASASAAVDALFEQLEKLAIDTADGLVIREEKAWQNLEEMMDTAERAGKRVAAARVQLRRVADKMDLTDPMTARFAGELKQGVIAYQVAADIPYADFDLGQQIENMITQVMEPVGDDGLQVRADAEPEIRKRANELLTACRTVRRYLRRIDSIRQRLADRELATKLDGPGRMLLLTEIRNQAANSQLDPIELLEKEFFLNDPQSGLLKVHPQRAELVGQMIERAKQLESELENDDF